MKETTHVDAITEAGAWLTILKAEDPERYARISGALKQWAEDVQAFAQYVLDDERVWSEEELIVALPRLGLPEVEEAE